MGKSIDFKGLIIHVVVNFMHKPLRLKMVAVPRPKTGRFYRCLVNKIGEIKRKFIGKTQLSTGAMRRENV